MGTDGVFVDCRTHWKGRIGSVAVSFSKYEGGVLAIGRDGADTGVGLDSIDLQLALRVRLVCLSDTDSEDHEDAVLIRQENDPAPKCHFLEEGPVRIGMRVAFDLLDDAGHYHGDGHQDVWVYPEGDVHVTSAVQTVDLAGHGAVQECYLEVQGDGGYDRLTVGDTEVADGAPVWKAFGADLPEKCVAMKAPDRSALLYWARDEGHAADWTADHGLVPPFYASRWPTGIQQWAWHGMGWACKGGGVRAPKSADGPSVDMVWLSEGTSSDDVVHGAALVVSVGEEAGELARRAKAFQNPLEPEVTGGNFRCASDEDGCYEVGQGDPACVRITFPPDALERTARVRYYRRKTDPRHRGGVVATANGEPVPFQLVSEGELTDDICVVMDMPPRRDSVDDVILSAPLSADRSTEIVIEKVPGIQATYQSEMTGVDLQRRSGNRRDVVVWSSRNKERPALEFDMFSSAVHRVTDHGQAEPCVWEVPMAWFRSCGNSKHHYCNFLKAFSIEKNGPEEVRLYARGTNPNQRAQSEVWVRIPYGHPRLRMDVRMRMEVLAQWDHANVEFSDIFPYPSRLVETWFHDSVYFLQRDGSAIKHSFRPDTSVQSSGEGDDDRLFYGLYPSDKGNILTLITNPQHPENKLHYSVCGNYVDIHVNMAPNEVPVPAGTAFEVEYVFEVYGDGMTSADEIRQIGLASLAAGDIVIP